MEAHIENLKKIAYTLRVDSLKATTHAGSGHPTSCLSAADIVAALFFYTLKTEDQFILSKGHAAPVVYAAYKELGIITEKELLALRTFDSPLEGHPTPRFPHIAAATGSLGQGLSIGAGIALARTLHTKNGRVYVMLGDSEMSEGSVWEALEVAAQYKLTNLIGIIDVNRLGQTTQTIDGWNTAAYQKKCAAFGWQTRVIDGHDMHQIIDALTQAQAADAPTMIIAKTIKGYGLPESIANQTGYHGKAFSHQELPALLEYLKKQSTISDEKTTYNKQFIEYIPKKIERKKRMIRFPEPEYSLGAKIATRMAYGEALAQAGVVAQEITALDAEVKNSTGAEIFEKAFPHRFVQCFIAEQNMIGMAQGFAIEQYIPFASTFSAFLSRAYDQLRMAAISKIPLRVVGSHAGVSVGQDGPSQMGLEDIGLFRMLPDSVILYPCDAVSTYKCVELMANYYDGISYLRTTRGATPVIYGNATEFSVGGCHVLRSSDKDTACIVAAGITVHEALAAYEELAQQDIFVRVIDCYSIKPLPVQALLAAAYSCKHRIITVEDHYTQGGLGEAIDAALCDTPTVLSNLAVTHMPRSGTKEELLSFEHIDAQAIVAEVLRYAE